MTQIPPRWLPDDSHDQRLLALVRSTPAQNPQPASRYNLVVIGGGPAGLVAAAGAAGLGAKVALVERDQLGGDCLHFGCVPSKALLRSAHLAGELRNAGRLGIEPSGPAIDFSSVLERVRRLRADIAENDSVARFQGLGIDVFVGDARFTSSRTLEVAGAELRFCKAVVATGGRPAIPTLPGLDRENCLTSENVFSLQSLPRRLVVLGGGPIGCELAQAFAQLGSQVTLVQRPSRLLPRDDPDASASIQRALEQAGVDVLCNSEALRSEIGADGSKSMRTIVVRDAAGERRLECDQVLAAAGRRPNVESLELAAAGVSFDPQRGIQVDDYLRTSNRLIYAAGDVCDTPFRFTHAADAMARIVVQNALFFGRVRWSRAIIPWCTYTTPEAAHVGVAASAAGIRESRYTSLTIPWTQLDRARLDDCETGWARVNLHAGSDRIAGATIVGRGAGDLITTFTLAMQAGWGLKRLAKVVAPYPTYGELVRKAADAYNRTRVTSTVRSWLGRFFEWQRGGL